MWMVYLPSQLASYKKTSSGHVVNNTTIVLLDTISRSKDYTFRPILAIIRSLSFDSLKIIFIQLCSGMFDAEISTSRPLFEYNISILNVWVNHVIMHKGINL